MTIVIDITNVITYTTDIKNGGIQIPSATRQYMMNDEATGEDLVLEVPVYVENDLEIDKDGNFMIQTFLFLNDDDETPTEMKIKFSDLIQQTIDYVNDQPSTKGTNTLYCIAHELTHQAEVLRSKGDYMDRGVYSSDLFGEETTEEDILKKANDN
jgi:hypothetical protein